ncbi:MAG: RNA-binding protein 28 [Marteilia pararefringens]
MSKEDRILRERVEKKNSELLRNPNTMISPLRICIVNLPNHVTAQVLKKYLLSKKLVKSRETQECKVIYQGGKMNDRSKHTGIAYITVNRHITAKKLVEFFNNNSHFSSRGKLIAYFSIENSLILAKKRQQTNGSFNRSQNEAMKPRPASKTTKGGKKNPIAKKAKLS